MAVAIPFIATAMGASATMATIITVGFAVTGMSEKINKAASNVFGEDLVKVANIAGAAYSVFNGGFDIGGNSAETVAALDDASSLANAASAESYTLAGDPLSAVEAANASAPMTEVGASMADVVNQAPTMNLAQMAETGAPPVAPSPSAAPVAAPTPSAPPPMQATAPAPVAATKATPVQFDDIPATSAPAQVPAAAAPRPPADTPWPAGDTARAQTIIDRQGGTPPVSESFIDKLIRMASDKEGKLKPEAIKFGGDMIMGLGAGYSAAKQREQYDEELAKRDANRNRGLSGRRWG